MLIKKDMKNKIEVKGQYRGADLPTVILIKEGNNTNVFDNIQGVDDIVRKSIEDIVCDGIDYEIWEWGDEEGTFLQFTEFGDSEEGMDVWEKVVS